MPCLRFTGKYSGEQKNSRSNATNEECFRVRDDNVKSKHQKNIVDKQLQKTEIERIKFERELKQALIDNRNTEHELFSCRKDQFDHKQRMDALLREKNTIARSKENIQDHVKRLNHELVLCQQSRKKVEYELDSMTHIVDEVKCQLEVVEKERDKYNSMVQGLEQQVKCKKKNTFFYTLRFKRENNSE